MQPPADALGNKDKASHSELCIQRERVVLLFIFDQSCSFYGPCTKAFLYIRLMPVRITTLGFFRRHRDGIVDAEEEKKKKQESAAFVHSRGHKLCDRRQKNRKFAYRSKDVAASNALFKLRILLIVGSSTPADRLSLSAPSKRSNP